MTSEEDHRTRPPPFWASRTAVLSLLCLCIGAAAIHANFSPVLRGTGVDEVEGIPAYEWGVGWPFWCGEATTYAQGGSASGPPSPPPLPSELAVADAYYFFVNLFIACILVASPLVVGRARLPGCLGRGQFTLSDLFSITTAVAMTLAIFSVERTYDWAKINAAAAVNSPLSSRPILDQVFVSLGIICALYVAIAALCQAFRSVIVRLRRL
jgi:hypothetical protein